MILKYTILFAILFGSKAILGQTNIENTVELNFMATYKNDHLKFNDTLSFNGSPLVIKVLKFYISNIQLYNQSKLVLSEKNSHHLIDFSKPSSLKQILQVEPNLVFDSIKYDLGIDSATNASGALEGDLDPSIGMYWAWQSGYINFKLEGYSEINPSRAHLFQFHLGGYLQPYLNIQSISFGVRTSKIIKLNLDLYEVLQKEDLIRENSIMSPSLKAVELSKNIAKTFTLNVEK